MSAAKVKTRVVGQVAPTTLGLTLVVSLGGLSFALLQGCALWAAGSFDRRRPSGHIRLERAA
jgi:hypothetical protein